MTRTKSLAKPVIDPWSEIGPSAEREALNVRRAEADHPLNFWRGRDFKGRYVFFLNYSEEGTDDRPLPVFTGIDLDRVTAGDKIRLLLTLSDAEHFDIFRTLCTDLLVATRSLALGDNALGAQVVLQRLRRWQEMLQKRKGQALGASAIVGLLGELLVLRDLVLPNTAPQDAVQSWRGPFGDEQDFLFAGRILEVKTQLSTSDRFLQISSEDQLDTESGPIMICHQTVGTGSDDEAVSLNEVVTELDELLERADPAARDMFQSALIEAGYERLADYDQPLWILNTRVYLEVTDDFPRIVPSGIPSGVRNVRYRIALAECLNHGVEDDALIQWAFHAR